MGISQLTIEGVLGDDDGAPVDTYSSTGAYSNKDGVLALGVVHKLDHLVHQDADRGRSHAVTDTQNGSNFVHRVAVRIGTDVLQLGASWQLVSNLVHDEVGKVLHALGRSTHASKLSKNSEIITKAF